jgi:two-component system phosphate regulon sensor histidine kinase PhoR
LKTRPLRTTFGKLALFLGLIYLSFLAVQYDSLFVADRSVRSAVSAAPDSTRILTIASAVEGRLLGRWTGELSDLAGEIAARPAGADSLIRQWMSGRKPALSVKVRLDTQQWPVLKLRDGLWEQPEIKALSLSKRKALFQALFFDDDGRAARDIAQSLPDSILGYPVFTVTIRPDAPPVRSVTVKVVMSESADFFQSLLEPGESLVVVDPGQRTLWSVRRIQNAIDPNAKADSTTAPFPLPDLGWTASLQRTLYSHSTTQRTVRWNAIGSSLLGLIALLGSAWLLARWIDRPYIRLLKRATEIGQGHFDRRIPDSDHPLIQKLVKMINFMVGEMDRLRRINIGGIINDKVKTEAILRNIADGIVVADAEKRVLVVNGVAENWFGLREEDVLSKPVDESIPSRTLIELFETVDRGETSASSEFSWTVAGESGSRMFQAHAARVESEDRFIGVIAVIRDVSLEREADRIKTELVSIVAHELKSPMSSIFGFSELLLEPDIEEEQRREYARIIMSESSRLTELVNKFLDLSRLESGRTEVRINPFDLRETILKVIDGMKSQIDKKQIKVITEIPDAVPFGMGDPDMIEQVLFNLLGNAIKYSPARSKIGIEVKNGKELQVSVIDNGYGIPKEELERIFDKFYRIPDASGEESDGTGLGLALVKEIIQRHGKTIQVKSRLGVGSVFSFTLSKAGGES